MSSRFRARRRAVSDVVDRVGRWAAGHSDVCSVVVVGSYAYGRPRMGSDLDLVIISSRAEEHLASERFVGSVTPGGRIIRRQQWGPMHERRVRLRSGLIVEFGLTTPAWVGLPLDAGTAKVLTDGCKVVSDSGPVSAALASRGLPVEFWRGGSIELSGNPLPQSFKLF